MCSSDLAVCSDEDHADRAAVIRELALAVEQWFDQWRAEGLADNGQASPYATGAAVSQLLGWTQALPTSSP